MGASPSKQELLQRLGAGGGVSSPSRNRLIDRTMGQVCRPSPDWLGGLEMTFRRIFHPSFLGDPLVVIEFSGLVGVSCPPRICTSGLFLYFYYTLLAPTAVASTSSSPSSTPAIEQCPICMDRNVTLSLSCGHAFCAVCEAEWMEIRNTCPICRAHQPMGEDWVLGDEDEPSAPEAGGKEKIFKFLLLVPRLDEFYGEYVRFEEAGESTQGGDGLGKWLESQLLLEGTVACSQCAAKVRVPASASAGDRLCCAACGKLCQVSSEPSSAQSTTPS